MDDMHDIIPAIIQAERERIALAIAARLDAMHSDWSNPRYEEAVRIARNGGPHGE